MSLHSRAQALKNRYFYLNSLIQDELSRPLPNSLHLFELKVKRLRLEEKLSNLN
ncbi:DUF465 domain-containing protein [Candidatus Bealeia paramacronuclearis]|uniref:DUF465 domain-containing protein n=1 Tax=Candidatus Bealeia paramacronuclearis TaxID=1921001 RepID=A0ABZ2C544_9PROT|nr:hypothetical protein [Candidatus Bealeia paramacronuclearis]